MTRMSRTTPVVFSFCLLCLFTTRAVAQTQLWQPYVEGEARGSSLRWLGQGNLFVPVWQDQDELMFLDMRGLYTDNSAAEGNWGLAYRKMVDSQYIFGLYGFYDLRQSEFSNTFHQGTLGTEILAVDWGIRFNGYIPEQGVKAAPGAASAYASGGGLFVRPGLEAAYWGTDAEVESLLWSTDGNTFAAMSSWSAISTELWGSAGVYHFDNSNAGFESMTGPRARLELRLYDLPLLGNDSRLVFAGQYEYDELRGSVGTGLLNVRIPLGTVTGGGSGNRLAGLSRRMVNPIVRDIDVVTNAGGYGVEECAQFANSGITVSQVVILDANDDIVTEVPNAGADSLVLLDGSAGEFQIVDPVVLQDGQVVMGGGSSLNVIGCDTGAQAVFTMGSRPTVNALGSQGQGRGSSFNAFEIADNSTLQGIDILGGDGGIVGFDVSNYQILDNTITSANVGVFLDGSDSGLVANNTASGNASEGFVFNNYFDNTTLQGNTANNNGAEGFYLSANVNQSTFDNNTASNNTGDGFDFVNDFSSSTFSANTAQNNSGDGFDFSDDVDSSELNNNIARNNGDDGFDFGDDVDNTELNNNISRNNGGNGFDFGEDIFDSVIANNVAEGNSVDGFYIEEDFDQSEFTGNIALQNGFHGFDFYYVGDSLIDGNLAAQNGSEGFYFGEYVEYSEITGNTSSSNGGTGFLFDYQIYDSEFSQNAAFDNSGDGVFVYDEVGYSSFNDNITSNNSGSGFYFDDEFNDSDFINNRASLNVDNGAYFGGDVSFAVIDSNQTSQNGESGLYFNGVVDTVDFVSNTANENTLDGFHFSQLLYNSLVDGNSASRNTVDGFFFSSIDTSSITNNTARNNTNFGFHVLGATAVTASGNAASGNGDNTLP